MRFDLGAAFAFLNGMGEPSALDAALEHPAYRAVFAHGTRYGNPLTPATVHTALAGKPSGFYGLRDIDANLPKIYKLLDHLPAVQHEWAALACAELALLLPDADFDSITVYPMIGYDMGIGLEGAVCLNLNTPQYLSEPYELLYFTIHEAAHVLYERIHPVPVLAHIRSPRDWQQYFALWLQNEGLAVYAALRLRTARGHLADRDYQVLSDPPGMAQVREVFDHTVRLLNNPHGWQQEQYLDAVFGAQRITYRAGCEIYRLLEQRWGIDGVRRALHLPPDAFLEEFSPLLHPPY